MLAHTHLTNTHSTNSQLLDWIILSYQEQSPTEHQRPHFSRPHLLTADIQTNGRGQHGRTWQSPLGNVYLSLYVPMTQWAQPNSQALSLRLDGRLSLCVGYQLTQMPLLRTTNQTRLQQNLPPIGVKWVNDVGFYQNQQFQKLSGILIEPVSTAGTMLGVVVGVGINVTHAPLLTAQTQEGLNYQAISLQDIMSKRLEVHDLYESVVDAIMQAIEQFNGFADSLATAQFVTDFAVMDVLKQRRLQIDNPINQSRTIGIAQGIDEQGCLLIQPDEGNIEKIWTGTIQVLTS